jgi:hypothetical protein
MLLPCMNRMYDVYFLLIREMFVVFKRVGKSKMQICDCRPGNRLRSGTYHHEQGYPDTVRHFTAPQYYRGSLA